MTNTEGEKAQAGAVWGLVPQSSGRWGVPSLEEPCGSEQLMTETNMEDVAVTRPGDGGRAAKWPGKDRGGGMFGAEGLRRERRGKSGKASSSDPREQTYAWLERPEWMWLQPWDRAASPSCLQRAGFPAASPRHPRPARSLLPGLVGPPPAGSPASPLLGSVLSPLCPHACDFPRFSLGRKPRVPSSEKTSQERL